MTLDSQATSVSTFGQLSPFSRSRAATSAHGPARRRCVGLSWKTVALDLFGIDALVHMGHFLGARRPRRVMGMELLRRVLGLALALPFVAACSDSEEVKGPGPSVELFSWWTSESEQGALDAVIAVHHKRFPSVQVINAAESLADKARDRLVDRMSTGLPPDTFQANIGKDLYRWVLFNGEDDSESKVENLDDLARENGWNRNLAPAVRDALSFEGRMYGVPMNVHRINSLFYDIRVLDELGLPLPESVDELFEVLEKLRAAGYQHPLSIGNRNNWTMSLFTMENLLPAVAGPQFYLEYFRGNHEPEHPLMLETLDTLLRLWPYFNTDAMDIDWTGGVELLFAEGKSQAVMTVMGDWAKGHLKAKGFEPGVDFGVIPFPGTRGTFVFTSDSFPLPKGAPSRSAAIELLTTLGSREGQLAFNALKGSIPARVDIDPKKDLDVLGREAWTDFQHDEMVVALSGLLDPTIATTLADALRETLKDEDPDPVLFALRNNHAQFSANP